MPIIFDVKRKLFHLKTRKSSYQIKISELGHLLHVYYGASVDDDMSYLIDRQDRGFSGNPWDAPDRTYSLDTLPQEYPFLGSGDYRETCLEQKDACGALAADGADPAILRLRLCRHFDEKREDHQPEHRSDSHGARAVVLCGFLCARAL